MRLALATLIALAGFCAPSAAQEREWILDVADQDAFLVFGVPETDDVGVSFWCRIGSGKVKLFFPEGSPSLKPDVKADFTLTIGPTQHTVTGTTSANDMTGATSIEAELPAEDAIFTELESADRFSAKIADHNTTYPLFEAGVENLLKLCKAK